MRRSYILLLAVITASFVISSVLYIHARTKDWNKYSDASDLLRDVRMQNALSNQDILKIRYVLFSDHDGLEQHTLELKDLILQLQTKVDQLQPEDEKDIPQNFDRLQTLLSKKLIVQEAFRSASAIFENSVVRLPSLVAELNSQIAGKRSSKIKLQKQLSPEVLLYGLINDDNFDQTLISYIKSLGALKISNKKISNIRRSILLHMETIINKRRELTQLLTEVLSIKLDETTQKLQYDYNLLHKDKLNEFTFFRNSLFAISIILVIYAALFFIKLTQKRHALAREQDRALVTLQSIGDGVITTDANSIVQFINPIAEQLTKWKNSRAKGKHLNEIFRVFDEITNLKIDDLSQRCISEKKRIIPKTHSILIDRDNTPIAIENSVAPILDNHNTVLGTIIVFRDVSDKRELSQKLTRQANHDALTHIYNRFGFDKELARLIEQAKQENCLHALLYIDLDQFKVVNDTCGHGAGDELLIQLTKLIIEQLPKHATVARLGGDEFGILLSDHSLTAAHKFAEELLVEIKQFRFDWQGINFQIGASIGLTPISQQSGDRSLILRAADMACYVAKDLGRNRVHVFNSNDHELVRRKDEMEWVAKLTDAHKDDRFVLYRQSIFNTHDINETSNHYEILVRLREPGGRLISPNAFIPAAERYNFMPTIDRWVIRTAFARHRWFTNGDIFSINLSGTTLNSETIVPFIQTELEKTALNADQVCFEITETAAITNIQAAANMMKVLKKMGFKFALDDFGKGLSSYSYLNNLPVDYLKIDGEYVKEINSNPVSYEIIRSVNEIAHLLGMKTIAEYVENDDILATLKTIGIDYVQGFNFGLPEPLDDSNIVERDDIKIQMEPAYQA